MTALEFDLIHLPTFYGGAIYFDGADAAAVIDRWRDWSAELPEQATTSFVIFQLPPLPEVPPPLAGRMTLGVRFLWTGDPDEGARLLDQIRAVAPVILDDADAAALHRRSTRCTPTRSTRCRSSTRRSC